MTENRITARLAACREQGKKALITYLVAGDPDLQTTLESMHGMVAAGVDLIELGVPFSDPAAEGPTIQRGHERALANHTRMQDVLGILAKFRQRDQTTPVLLMGYANPIEWIGLEKFADAASMAGADGVLTVDLPPEESSDFSPILAAHNMVNIFLVAPTTSPTRMESIAKAATGFIYYVSLKGVTGSDKLQAGDIAERVAEIRKHSDLPVCVGFGIKSAADAASMAKIADGVVIGSAIVELMTSTAGDMQQKLVDYLAEIRAAID